MTEQANPNVAGSGPQFAILRTYLKDVSLETPNSPACFLGELKPQISLQLNTSVNELDKDTYEVVLDLTVTAQEEAKTAFLVQVQQAGIFKLHGFEEPRKAHTLAVFCPETLFPFAREAVSDLVVKGGFPQLLLAPINFEALYAQKRNEKNAEVAAPTESAH